MIKITFYMHGIVMYINVIYFIIIFWSLIIIHMHKRTTKHSFICLFLLNSLILRVTKQTELRPHFPRVRISL